MRIPYFPGCSLKTTGKNFEQTALAVTRILGIELVELPRWVCCGTVHSLTTDDLIHHVAPVRNLVRTQQLTLGKKQGQQLITLCSMCYNTLKTANSLMKKESEKLKTINEFMDREDEYQGNVEVLHLLELYADQGSAKIHKYVKKPLHKLKVSPYYGCLLLRPREVAIDDSESPTILENLMSDLGAVVVDNPYKTKCCGSYHTTFQIDLVADIVSDILSHATKIDAEVIVMSCPLCAFNLDERQKEIIEKNPNFTPIPILYFTQLMGLAFGLDTHQLGFDLHYIDPKPILIKKNLIND